MAELKVAMTQITSEADDKKTRFCLLTSVPVTVTAFGKSPAGSGDKFDVVIDAEGAKYLADRLNKLYLQGKSSKPNIYTEYVDKIIALNGNELKVTMYKPEPGSTPSNKWKMVMEADGSLGRVQAELSFANIDKVAKYIEAVIKLLE